LVIDTNTFLSLDYLRPLLASARVGDLVVLWSPPMQREIERVVYRQGVIDRLRRSSSESPALAVPEVRETFNAIGAMLEAALAETEQVFHLVVDWYLIDDTLVSAITDPADHIILRTALAGRATLILS
jgi:hypothetical protein